LFAFYGRRLPTEGDILKIHNTWYFVKQHIETGDMVEDDERRRLAR
jgi:hypothetical protein